MSASVVVIGIDGRPRGVVARTERDRATVAAWRRGVDRFLETGDAYLIARLAGRRVGHVKLATDLSVIEAAARAGVL